MKRGMKKVMKDEIKLTREELHEARAWAQDESWVKRKKYERSGIPGMCPGYSGQSGVSVHGSVYSAWTDYL